MPTAQPLAEDLQFKKERTVEELDKRIHLTVIRQVAPPPLGGSRPDPPGLKKKPGRGDRGGPGPRAESVPIHAKIERGPRSTGPSASEVFAASRTVNMAEVRWPDRRSSLSA